MTRSTCYHCRVSPPNRHSVFCDTCLRGVSRPLFYPDARPAKRPFTRLLYGAAAAATVWLIVKTAEYVSA